MNFLVIKPTETEPICRVIFCEDTPDASYNLLQRAVGGFFDLITGYFKDLPAGVDAWCNDECLINGLDPILVFHGRKDFSGLIAGNIVFTATDEYGETIGLTDDQISMIQEMLDAMPKLLICRNDTIFRTYLSII